MSKSITRLYEQSRLSDEDLVAAAKNGELSAMDELLSRYREQVCSVVRHRTKYTEEAEDIVQEATLRAFVNIRRFRGESRFSSWLITIANNVLVSMKRKQWHARRIYLEDSGDKNYPCNSSTAADLCPTPEQCCLQKERHKLLQQKALKLRPKYRIILRKRICNRSTIKEIVRDMNIPCGTVKSRLYCATRMLSDAVRVNDFSCKKQMEYPRRSQLIHRKRK